MKQQPTPTEVSFNYRPLSVSFSGQFANLLYVVPNAFFQIVTALGRLKQQIQIFFFKVFVPFTRLVITEDCLYIERTVSIGFILDIQSKL